MNIYLYILVMAVVTYLIRALPLTLIRGKIKNRFFRSFLYYVPYACLMAMTFPAVFCGSYPIHAAIAGVAVAFILAVRGKNLLTVALAASITVFIVSFIPLG
ncbi:MAG: AzlD domain-containing protein [Lachnospiraceae bacterium]|nr:AzlD domain-containing protein [Lachnospiraceae bacterium]MBP5183652.1 AzlD domain-containing protein [Lachnospiraceae bacterium]